MVLTNKQREELNSAIFDYLKCSGLNTAAEALQKESNAEELDPKKTGLLEGKWTSVLRLSKKVIDLETKIKQLEEEMGSKPNRRDKNTEGIPRAPELHTLSGHRDDVHAVKFHPVYTLLVSASQDATLKIWDYDSGELERTLRGHTDSVNAVDFDHTGNYLVSSSADLSIKLWDFQSYECLKTMHGHDHNVSSVIFLPSGDQIVSASRDKTIKIWETSTGYCLRTLVGHEEWIRTVIASDDGAYLASAGHDKTVRLWDLGKGEVIHVMKDHSHFIECLDFSPSTITQLETNDGKVYKGKQGPGNFIASGSRDKTIKIWETATGQCISTLIGHDNWVKGVLFHPSGKHLISVSDDKTIRIWDLKQGRAIKTIYDAHTHFVSCIDFCVNNPHLVTGSVDRTVKVWSCR